MNVDKDNLEKIAHLSRLYFDESDEERMLKSMNDIIDWMAKLNEVSNFIVVVVAHNDCI